MNTSELKMISKALHLKHARHASKNEIQDACFEATWELIVKGEKLTPLKKISQQLSQLTSSEGKTLMVEAIVNRDETRFNALIDLGVDLNVEDEDGNTLLHHAAHEGTLNFVGKLWEFIAINSKNSAEQTPLFVACLSGQSHIASSLIQNGADCDIKGQYLCGEKQVSVTPLHLAIILGSKDCIDALISNSNPALNATTIGHSLHLAVHFHQSCILQHLLSTHYSKFQPLVNQANEVGVTPLMHAAFLGEGASLTVLKEKGANLEQQDPQGRTALHWASIGKQRASIEILASFNASLQPVDQEGNRPYDLLRFEKNAEAKSLASLLSNLLNQKQIIDLSPPLFSFKLPENLVFKGGGPKGIAYVGAVEVLEEKGVLGNVKRVAGTSAGAINSILLALGYSAIEMKKILGETDLSSFLDHPLTKQSLTDAFKNLSFSSTLKTLYNLVKNPTKIISEPIKYLWHCTGICEGEIFRKWMEELVFAKTGIAYCTFGEFRKLISQGFPFKHLCVFATNAEKKAIARIDSESPMWDDVIISDAIRASMSIPGAFKPHILHIKTEANQRIPNPQFGVFLDGGMLNNFPIEAYDKKKFQTTVPMQKEGEYHMLNKQTLGFSLYSAEEVNDEQPKDVKSVKDLISAIIKIYFDAEDILRKQNSYNDFRVIDIDNLGVGTLSFNISDKKKEDLCHSGRNATEKFFTKQEEKCSKSNSLFLYPRVVKTAQGRLRLQKPHSDFVGRHTYLKSLLEDLLTQRQSDLPVIALCGEGGVGKSEIAIAFGNTHLNDFSLIFTVNCSDSEAYLQDYKELSTRLRIPFKESDNLSVICSRVHRCLEQEPFNKPWLLILDSVDEPLELPQRGKGSILITTRTQISWEGVKFINVSAFETDEGVQLFKKILQKDISETGRKLVQKLKSYPLALNQACHFISETPGMNEKKYLDLLQQNSAEMLESMPTSSRYEATLPASWKVTADHLNLSHPNALSFLRTCAFMAPEQPIPIKWLEKWVEQTFSQFNRLKKSLMQAKIIRTLTLLSLVQVDENEEIFRLHKLRCELIKNEINKKENRVVKQAAFLLAAAIEGMETKESIEWNQVVYTHLCLWGPHAFELLSKKLPSIPKLQRAQLLNGRGNLLWMQGQYYQAEDAHRQALNASTQNDLLTTYIKGNLAWDREKQGNSHEALKLFETLRDSCIHLLGPNHFCTANAMHGIGWCQGSCNKYKEAEVSIKTALKIRRKCFGIRHPSLVATLHDLGWVLEKQNKISEALECIEQALKIREELPTPSHPSTIVSYKHNLGRILEKNRKYQKALELHEEAYELNKNTYGLDHPYVLDSLNNLLRIYKKAKKSKKKINEVKKLIGAFES